MDHGQSLTIPALPVTQTEIGPDDDGPVEGGAGDSLALFNEGGATLLHLGMV